MDEVELLTKANEKEIAANVKKIKQQFLNYQPELQIYRAHPNAKLPVKATEESAGYDLYTIEGGTLLPGESLILSLGLIMRPPTGFHIKVWGRSGWGMKYGVGIPHGMGLVDRDYCGPNDIMKVVLHRALTNNPDINQNQLIIDQGDRIAQMT